MLYVYSESALTLLLDGVKAGETHTMSNVNKIAGLWGQGGQTGSEAIVALQRDIALKNVISINYGDYAWAELADQIAWASKKADGTSGSSIASINYQQGVLYENIENFSYTSYRPSSSFILSGLGNGTTTITTTHVRTGLADSLTVNVETLRDKLYLFQCYPKGVTTLTYEVYTNESRSATSQMTLDTNANGEAAIYAPYGIAGNVYCKAQVKEDEETVTYLGTIYGRNLASSEGDSARLQLYPVNTIQLRRAAQAEIYLQNPNGTPYANKAVTFQGGVYRQGEYCDQGVYFGLQGKGPYEGQGDTGDVAQTVITDANGRLLVTMDLSQFKTSPEQEDVQAGEALYYLFQLNYGDGSDTDYYSMLLRVDATLNAKDVAATGQSIAVWEKNEQTSAQPFIAMQTIQYSQSATATPADVRKGTSYVGPSTTFPEAWLTTTVMWWGDAAASNSDRVNKITLRDSTSKALPQQESHALDLPFSNMVMTENVTRLDRSGMTTWGVNKGKTRTVSAELSKDGASVYKTISLPFQIVNMIGTSEVENAFILTDTMDNILSSMTVDANGSESFQGSDQLIMAGIASMAGKSKYDASQAPVAVRVFATSDPTVFRAFFCLNVGNMETGHNVSGVYPNYTDAEDPAFYQVDSAGKPGDFDFMSSAIDVYHILKGNFRESAESDGTKADNNKAVRNFSMDLGGYFEADIAYNSETEQWECRPIAGGFHAGGGVSFSWFFNSLVGPVPVTMSLTLGGTVEVSLDMQQGNYYRLASGREALAAATTEAEFNQILEQTIYWEQTANDYLTTLRLFLYIRVFAGMGFDYSVVAFKVGIFGQLNLDFNFNWLNRDYLADTYNISAVGPLSSRDEPLLAGQEPRFSGTTGIEFLFKFLFVSYEHVFCSIGFELDGQYGDWTTIEEIWAENKTINNRPVTRMALPNGQTLYTVDLGPRLESRDYVDASTQEWVGGQPGISLFSLDPNQDATLAKALQTGAYSYAAPVLTDDGEIMLYLSDRGEGV